MQMEIQEHPDPFTDALQHGVQRAVQLASCAVTAGQVYLYHQRAQASGAAEREFRARRAREALHTQARAARDAARAGWAPALDQRWLRHATFLDTARAWGAAMPYADPSVPWYEPTAVTALRVTEERLRSLHPYGMGRYDRLRADGLNPADAMREAAPFFARPAHAHDAPATPRPALGAHPAPPEEGQPTTAAGRAHPAGTAPGTSPAPGLGEGTQNPASAPAPAAAANPAAARARRTARTWEHDFPMPIQDVVAHASRDLPVGEVRARRRPAPAPARLGIRQP